MHIGFVTDEGSFAQFEGTPEMAARITSNPWVEVTSVPLDRVFRDTWELGGSGIVEPLLACQEVAHACRRVTRANELLPHDIIVAYQVPGTDAVAAEAARVIIRAMYAEAQLAIDEAVDADEVREVIELYGLIEGYTVPVPVTP